MNLLRLAALVVLLQTPAPTAAQQPPAAAAPQLDPTTTTGSATATYRSVKTFILRSAEKMPAEHFGFQPTPDVRSFGQVLAHIADANYLLCSPALGEANPNGTSMQKIEGEKLGRDAMLAKLKETFDYCDRAYAKVSEANGDEQVTFFNNKRSRAGALWFHVAHAFEHYGNLVTYLRLKGIVPPSSEPRSKN
jgi:uncharacterized damage-inducible protein DinB